MLFGFGGSKPLVGIDIGSSAVKVIAGTKSGRHFTVKNFGVAPLPFRAKDERGISNPDAVKSAIEAALENAGLTKKEKFSTSIYGASVQLKTSVLPKMPKKEIPMQAQFEAEQVFPSDGAKVLSEYILLGEGGQAPGAPPGTTGWEILLIGVRQEEATMIYNLLESCQIQVDSLDIDSFVMSDFLDGLIDVPQNEAVGFVDVGASGTRVCVRHKGNTIFLREFFIGGFTFTETIAQTLGMTVENADSLKIQDGAGIPQEAIDALQNIFSTWKSELRQCEDIFVTQTQNLLVSRWYISGGGSLTPGLLESLNGDRLSEKIILVQTSDFFKIGKTVNPHNFQTWSPRLISAAGLSCRKA